jgi:hypothetical protein
MYLFIFAWFDVLNYLSNNANIWTCFASLGRLLVKHIVRM